VNPNSYYESLGRPGMRGGERERQLAAFSRNAIVAAEVRPAIKAYTAKHLRAAMQGVTIGALWRLLCRERAHVQMASMDIH